MLFGVLEEGKDAVTSTIVNDGDDTVRWREVLSSICLNFNPLDG